MPVPNDNRMGAFLRDRRAKLDPTSFGIPLSRRRTPGLRREEVAQRANVSATWYTWLEQGRGGAPSADVLDRIARALMLTDAEREHLYLLGLGRPAETHRQPSEDITPRLQRVLDALEVSPAYVKTPIWDVIAWNRAASAVLTDYGTLEAGKRNILRVMFSDPHARSAQADWQSVARFVVAAFRADAARAGDAAHVKILVEELSQLNPEFEAMWAENDVRSYGGGSKRIIHPQAGPIAFEYSAFAVDGRPDLGMVVYNPATPEDADRIRALMNARSNDPNIRSSK